MKETDSYLEVISDTSTYKISKLTGVIESLKYYGNEMLQKPSPYLDVYRAPTDNDLRASFFCDEWVMTLWRMDIPFLILASVKFPYPSMS